MPYMDGGGTRTYYPMSSGSIVFLLHVKLRMLSQTRKTFQKFPGKESEHIQV